MPTVNLSDDAYRAAVAQSVAGGFASVSEYLTDVILDDPDGPTPDLEHLFTPERMARIARGEADVAAGRTYTSAEVAQHFAKRRAERVATP